MVLCSPNSSLSILNPHVLLCEFLLYDIYSTVDSEAYLLVAERKICLSLGENFF